MLGPSLPFVEKPWMLGFIRQFEDCSSSDRRVLFCSCTEQAHWASITERAPLGQMHLSKERHP